MATAVRIKRWRVWIVLVVVSALAAYLYLGRFGSTPPFRDAGGAVIPGSVAEMHRLRLGGVDQSVVFRGRNAKAPILIWLHGGPGMDATGLGRYYNAALEDHFLVVYWTQRGTGRSHDASIPVASMKLAQFVADLDELVAILLARFDQQGVVLVGHSWGTSIGVAYAQMHPDKVSAYVGIGQIANARESERRSYAFTIAQARRRGNAEALGELARIGPPPHSIDELLLQRKWLEAFGGAWREPVSMIALMRKSFEASEVTLYDFVKFRTGLSFSITALAEENARIDWLNTATQFRMPVFIVSGRFDRNTDAALAHSYFEKLSAPAKQFKWFENSAHSPLFEEPEAFNAYIIQKVLPVARQHSTTLTASPPSEVSL